MIKLIKQSESLYSIILMFSYLTKNRSSIMGHVRCLESMIHFSSKQYSLHPSVPSRCINIIVGNKFAMSKWSSGWWGLRKVMQLWRIDLLEAGLSQLNVWRVSKLNFKRNYERTETDIMQWLHPFLSCLMCKTYAYLDKQFCYY